MHQPLKEPKTAGRLITAHLESATVKHTKSRCQVKDTSAEETGRHSPLTLLSDYLHHIHPLIPAVCTGQRDQGN